MVAADRIRARVGPGDLPQRSQRRSHTGGGGDGSGADVVARGAVVKLHEVTVELAEAIRDVNSRAIDRAGLAKRLQDLAERLAPGDLKLKAPDGVAPAVSVPKAHRDAWKRIWAYWLKATGKTRSKPTPERKRAVLARLRDGYSEDDIKRAVDGCLSSEHHVDGGHIDLTLIARNGSKLEAFVEKAGAVPAYSDDDAVPSERSAAIRKLEDESMAALAAGDTDLYQALQEQIERKRRP
jgi:hypothetical protein